MLPEERRGLCVRQTSARGLNHRMMPQRTRPVNSSALCGKGLNPVRRAHLNRHGGRILELVGGHIVCRSEDEAQRERDQWIALCSTPSKKNRLPMIYLVLEVGATAPGITDRCTWRGLISQHSRSNQHQLPSLSNTAHQHCKIYIGFDILKAQQRPSSV